MNEELRSINVDNHNDGPWAEAIQEATLYAFVNHQDEFGPPSNSRNYSYHSSHNAALEIGVVAKEIDRVDRSLSYLEKLQLLLEQEERKEIAPNNTSYPPAFGSGYKGDTGDSEEALLPTMKRASTSQKRDTASGTIGSISNRTSKSYSSTTNAMDKTEVKKKKPTRSDARSKSGTHWQASKNRYALIAVDSDDDSTVGSCGKNNEIDNEINKNDRDKDNHKGSEEEDIDTQTNVTKKSHLSYDAIPFAPSLSFGEDRSHEHMDTKRLLIRLYTSQSDLHAKKARLLSLQRRWLQGAGQLQSSIISLGLGLTMADNAISELDYVTINRDHDADPDRKELQNTESEAKSNRRRVQLEQDAHITSISTNYLVVEQDRYLKTAHRQVSRLKRILEPMWKARDDAKKRMGHHKWANNKNKKGSFAKARIRYELQLESAEVALRQLEDSETDASLLVDEASRLSEKLRQIRYKQNRYNGRRLAMLPQVMNFDEFPSLALNNSMDSNADTGPIVNYYGWNHTGCLDEENCMFYEKWSNLGSQTKLTLLFDSNCDRVPNEHIIDGDSIGPFVLTKLDFYVLTGEYRTMVEYPARYDGNGTIVSPAWVSTLDFNTNGDDQNHVDPDTFHQIMMDPLSVHRLHRSCTNVAVLPS